LASTTNDVLAPLGRYGCDPPIDLVEKMMKTLADQAEDFDAIIVPGDFVAHGITYDPKESDSGNYTLLKETLSSVSSLFDKYFPNTPVMPSFGNNDCKYHYQAPYTVEKEEYYSFIYDIWFNKRTANQKVINGTNVMKTFMNGGYYRYDLNDKLSLLSINTLYYNKKNNNSNQQNEAIEMSEWLT
jgi:hypothetical protein